MTAMSRMYTDDFTAAVEDPDRPHDALRRPRRDATDVATEPENPTE